MVEKTGRDLQIKCQPVAINSGNIWPKSGKLKSNGILFCATKHREGSDISKLDACIFLDYYNDIESVSI